MRYELSARAVCWIAYIESLSLILHDKIGNAWWYSLVQEKNIFKSMSFHNFFKMNVPDNRFVKIKAVSLAILKYLTFIYRYLNKFTYSSKSKICSTVIFTYGEDHLKLLEEKEIGGSTFIAIPTKNNYGRLLEEKNYYSVPEGLLEKRKYYIIDEWLCLKDFFFVLRDYFTTVFLFLLNYKTHVLQDKVLSPILLRDWWYSFAGGVLIEGLFYEWMFKNLKSKSEIFCIKYVFENHAWEKALCIVFKDTYKIGILQSAVGANTLHYYCGEKESKIIPKPDWLWVYGEIAKEVMEVYFPDMDIEVIGDLRGNVDKINHVDFKWGPQVETLVVLGPIKRANRELLDWAYENLHSFIIKNHRDDRTDYQVDSITDFYRELPFIESIVTYSSTLAVEASAIGIPVYFPDLPSFVPLELFGVGERLGTHFSKFEE